MARPADGRSGERGSRRRRRRAPRRPRRGLSTGAEHPTRSAPPSTATPTNDRTRENRSSSSAVTVPVDSPAHEDRPRPRAARAGRRRSACSPHSIPTAGAGSTWRSRDVARSGATSALPTTASCSASRSRRSTTTWRAGCASRRWARCSSAFEPTDDDDDAIVRFGRSGLRAADPATHQPARLLRLRAPRRDDVVPTRPADPRGLVPAADLLLQQRVGDPRPGRSGLGAARIDELDYELEICALIDTPVRDLSAERGEEAIGGYMVMNDWSARDLQRDETAVRLGPGQGQGLRHHHRPVAGDARRARRRALGQGLRPGRHGRINGQELSRGSWSDIALQLRRDDRARLRRRPPCPGRPRSAQERWGPAACWRFRDESGFGR